MNSSAKRALITGINSFTGYYLEQELQTHGWEVFGTGLGLDENNPRYRQMDLSETAAMQAFIAEVKPTAVVHLAAISFVADENVADMYAVNLLGTRNLLSAIVQSKASPEAVLLVSSAQVYGRGHSGVLTESTEKRPANDYAVSKLAMEYLAGIWTEKLPIIITRPFNYTGRGQGDHFLIPKIVSHFKSRKPVIELGNLDVWRDFSDVRMVAQAYRKLLESDRAIDKTVNICSGSTHSLREILAMAEKISGHTLEIKVNPAFVRENEVKTLSGDTSRLAQLLDGWDPMPFEDTLSWMLSTPK